MRYSEISAASWKQSRLRDLAQTAVTCPSGPNVKLRIFSGTQGSFIPASHGEPLNVSLITSNLFLAISDLNLRFLCFHPDSSGIRIISFRLYLSSTICLISQRIHWVRPARSTIRRAARIHSTTVPCHSWLVSEARAAPIAAV